MIESEPNPGPKSIIGRTFRSLWEFTGELAGSGSRSLRPLHRKLVDALMSSLDPEIRSILEKQISQPYYMQFWHGGRISPFFFRDFNLPHELRIPDSEFADRLYKVDMFVDGRKQKAHVTFYMGRIHCLEFNKPLKFYEGKDVYFGLATLGKPRQSFTRAIDRLEHGKDSSGLP